MRDSARGPCLLQVGYLSSRQLQLGMVGQQMAIEDFPIVQERAKGRPGINFKYLQFMKVRFLFTETNGLEKIQRRLCIEVQLMWNGENNKEGLLFCTKPVIV